MPRIAFVFPGQGAQYVGMGREIAESYPEAVAVFEEADGIVGYSIKDLCFYGPQEKLDQTEYSQPALLTTSIAILKVVQKNGIKPSILAGLSLGEYTALVAAGSLEFSQALPLVQTRAALMQQAVPAGQGAMAAVMGMSGDTVREICRQAGGIVDVANYNAPGQVVISGEAEAVDRAKILIKEAGGRVVPLAISVPSHSLLMKEAAMQLGRHLQKVSFKEPSPEVVSNVNAKSNPARNMPDLLVKQLFSPVLWEQSIRYMIDKADYFLEIGPSNTLSGLIKRIDKSKLLGNVENVNTLNKVMEKVKTI